MAGFHELLAVEWDDGAVETFRLNFPGVPIYHGDICRLTVDECLQTAGLESGALDVLDGSPPCQGFSMSGRRDLTDDRNQLFREFVRLLRGLRPKVFVMENVFGLVKGKMRLIFADIVRGLKASGYRVSARVLDAVYFGVPQSRQRTIILGTRSDIGIEPTHPQAQSVPYTAGYAVEECEVDANEIRWLLDAGIKYAAYREWADIPIGKTREQVFGKSGFSCSRFHPGRPARTIMKSDGNIQMRGSMHWSERRRFSLAEFKRIGSFPDAFQFAGNYTKAVGQIGNSVPPLFMRAIAQHIRKNILDQCAS